MIGNAGARYQTTSRSSRTGQRPQEGTMAGELTIHVGYKRTFQVKPYETQVIEFSVTGSDESDVIKQCSQANLKKLAVAYQAMEETGDAIIAETMSSMQDKQPTDPTGFTPAPSKRK